MNELQENIEIAKTQCNLLYKSEIDILTSELENICMNKTNKEADLIRIGFYSALIELKTLRECEKVE